MNNLSIRLCGSGWEYCSGDCKGCSKTGLIATSSTPHYSYNSGLCNSAGTVCLSEDLDYLFQAAETGDILNR